jgi:hypothetical protein
MTSHKYRSTLKGDNTWHGSVGREITSKGRAILPIKYLLRYVFLLCVKPIILVIEKNGGDDF